MIIFKVVANRQLAQYNSDDRNINVSSRNICQDIFQNILDDKITTINNEDVHVDTHGATKTINFNIKDKLLNKYFASYFSKSPRELRLQLLEYVEKRKIIPGDIITIYIEINNTNCDIQIKSDSIYRYVLERKSQRNIKYRIFIEFPNGTNNAGITDSKYTDEYLKLFNIEKLDEPIGFGSTEFTAYILSGCTSKYIGVPHNKNLKINSFDNIEEII